MRFLTDSSPIDVTQRSVNLCDGWYCKMNYDTLISSGVSILLTVLVAFLVLRSLRSGRPTKLQMVFEGALSYVRDLVRDNVGAEAAEEAMPIALPIAMTVAFYIFISNWLDFFPLTKPLKPANADLNQTLALAVVVFIVVQVYSFKVSGFKNFFRKFTKPFELPLFARVLFVPLNVIEEVAKPLTLSLRLFGNLFGGLLVVGLLAALAQIGTGLIEHTFIGALSVALLAGWKAFDVIFIGSLQAYIFMLLTIIYFGMAREGLHGLEGHQPHPAHT